MNFIIIFIFLYCYKFIFYLFNNNDLFHYTETNICVFLFIKIITNFTFLQQFWE